MAFRCHAVEFMFYTLGSGKLLKNFRQGKRGMARRLGHQSWGMYAKNNSNQREVGFFLHHWKKKIKLLPQLWVEIFAFSSGNTASSSPLWFLGWCFLNLVLQAKLPDGSCPLRRPGHARLSGLMNELLPCTSDLCIATFPAAWLQTLSVEASCVEIHGPPWEQTTSLKSLVRGTERLLLSGTLETVLVFWTLTWVQCDHSEVEAFSSLYSFYFFLFRSNSPHFFFSFPKFLGRMW